MGRSRCIYEFSEDYGNDRNSFGVSWYVCLAAYYRYWIFILLYGRTGILRKSTWRYTRCNSNHIYPIIRARQKMTHTSHLSSSTFCDCILCYADDCIPASERHETRSCLFVLLHKWYYAVISCMEMRSRY